MGKATEQRQGWKLQEAAPLLMRAFLGVICVARGEVLVLLLNVEDRSKVFVKQRKMREVKKDGKLI